MICAVIKGPSIEEAARQIEKVLEHADLVELRLDYFHLLDVENIKQLKKLFSIPMIFTLRSYLQGGEYTGSEESRWVHIKNLAQLKPEFFDLESSLPISFFEEFSVQYPEVKLIVSYHNFIETPSNLEEIYEEMKKKTAFFYKIAVLSHSCLDTLFLLDFAKQKDSALIVVSMGNFGEISRILGPIVGSPITYACVSEEERTALGQFSVETLIRRYRYPLLGPQTAIYGLIGNPVTLSISDETHNHLMEAIHLDAVYVKIQVKESELEAFLVLAKRLSFKGLSVTMPLKEFIIQYLDELDIKALRIGAVNTLVFQGNKILGFNTDGLGALDVIEKKHVVRGKNVLILGAGGSSKAIAYEALFRGGIVTILNRDQRRAMKIGEELGCKAWGLDRLPLMALEGYDIIINCTPVSLEISAQYILSSAVFMDINTKPKETLFLENAKSKGCEVIYGYQMFIEQAIEQFSIWFQELILKKECQILLEKKSLEQFSQSL